MIPVCKHERCFSLSWLVCLLVRLVFVTLWVSEPLNEVPSLNTTNNIANFVIPTVKVHM
jgi:hypothetical protein